MANYYTKASLILPMTEEQATFALEVKTIIECGEVDLTNKHKSKAAKQYPNDAYKLAKRIAKDIPEYKPEDETYLSFDASYEADNHGLWIRHDETLDSEQVALYCHNLLKHFDIDTPVSINVGHTCSKAYLDGFGGEAAFVTKRGIKWFSTHQWLLTQERRYQKKLAA